MVFSLLWTPSSSIAAFERCSVCGCSSRMIGGVPRFGHITDYMRDVGYSTGSQFSSASTIGCHLLSSIVFLVTRLLIFWRSLNGLLWLPISPLGLQGGLSGATC